MGDLEKEKVSKAELGLDLDPPSKKQHRHIRPLEFRWKSKKRLTMDSSPEKDVVTDLVTLLVGGSLFCKPTELNSAIEFGKDTDKKKNKEHLKMVSFVANNVCPPKHTLENKNELFNQSLHYAKGWVDRLTEPIHSETKITFSDLVEMNEAVMTSPYLSKELLLPDTRKGKVGVFWNFMLCPIPKDVDCLKIFEIISARLVANGYSNGMAMFAFGDQTCLSGDEEVCKVILEALSHQSVKVFHSPKADPEKGIKEVAEKEMIIKMMDWAFEYQRKHHEPGAVVAITSDLNFRYCINELKSKTYGFEVLLSHTKAARLELIHSASVYNLWEEMITVHKV